MNVKGASLPSFHPAFPLFPPLPRSPERWEIKSGRRSQRPVFGVEWSGVEDLRTATSWTVLSTCSSPDLRYHLSSSVFGYSQSSPKCHRRVKHFSRILSLHFLDLAASFGGLEKVWRDLLGHLYLFCFFSSSQAALSYLETRARDSCQVVITTSGVPPPPPVLTA